LTNISISDKLTRIYPVGVLIGETTITSIPTYGSSQASINWTIPTASSRIVFVKLDSSNTKDNLWRLGYNSTKRVA